MAACAERRPKTHLRDERWFAVDLSDRNRGSFRRHRGWAVASLAMMVVLGVVSAQLLRTSHHRTQLQVATTVAYAQARTGAEQRRAEADDLVRLVVGPATYRASNVFCRLETDEAGWQVQNWRQVCTIRTVDVYPTRLGYTDLAARLVSTLAGHPDELLGAALDGYSPREGCGNIRSYDNPEVDPQLSVVVSRLQARRFSAATSSQSQECRLPLLAQPDTPNNLRTRVDATFSTNQVDVERSWVVVERETVFFHQELGCAGVVYCASPVRFPVLP